MGWGESHAAGAGPTGRIEEVHDLLDKAGIPPGNLADRVERALMSTHTVDGERQTWRQLYEREHEHRVKADRWAQIVSDLDRCQHGRHEGDVCGGRPPSGCDGPSSGNPLTNPTASNLASFGAGLAVDVRDLPARTFGFSIDGLPIVDPGRERRHDPDAWYRR